MKSILINCVFCSVNRELICFSLKITMMFESYFLIIRCVHPRHIQMVQLITYKRIAIAYIDDIEEAQYRPSLSMYIPIYSLFNVICYSFMIHSFHKAFCTYLIVRNRSSLILLMTTINSRSIC